MKSFFESNITAKEWILKESIPQESIVRGEVGDRESNISYDQAFKDYNIKREDLVGWFANKYNMAFGWGIFKASDYDKKEFGQDVFRSYSESTNATSIIRFNLLTGTYAFIDNEAYEHGDIKFEKMTKYDRLFIEPTDIAYKEFDIV